MTGLELEWSQAAFFSRQWKFASHSLIEDTYGPRWGCLTFRGGISRNIDMYLSMRLSEMEEKLTPVGFPT